MSIADRLEAIRLRLAALAEHDRERVVFGAAKSGDWGHDYALGPAMEEHELAAFEKDHGVTLPPSYRAMLGALGNGGAGPYYGLSKLTPLERGQLPQNSVEVRLDGELIGRSATGPREVPSARSSLARPFPLIEEWSPDDGALPVVSGTSPYDGCVYLSDQGCGHFDFLVVNGTRHGEVWSDFTAGGGHICKAHDDFLEWYEAWLDRAELEWIEQSAAPKALAAEGLHPGVAAYVPKLETSLDGPRAEWADGWRALGYARLAAHHPGTMAALERAAELGEDEPAARLALDRARVCAREGRHEEALTIMAAGLEDPDLWASTGTELLCARLASLDALGREGEALAALRELVNDAFWTLEHHHALARRHLARSEPTEAIAVLMDAVERDIGPARGITKATRAAIFEGFLKELEDQGAHDLAARFRDAARS